jgi:hypothetical protein
VAHPLLAVLPLVVPLLHLRMPQLRRRKRVGDPKLSLVSELR